MAASFRFHRHKLGAIGCTVGIAPHIFVGAYGEDKVSALAGATQVAAQLKQTLQDHPELQALMNTTPYGAAALYAINHSAEIIKAGGDVADVAAKVGPQAAGVVGALLKLF